jgi:Fe-S oxidoreductase
MDIKTVLVSCGTCLDQLMTYEFEKIFPGCRLMDIHEYLMEKEICLEGGEEKRYLYHDPCHSPTKIYPAGKVVNTLMGADVLMNDRCCGEAGTLAVSRPDIANQVRFRKEEELDKGLKCLERKAASEETTILTSCPACLQGLSRFEDDTGVKASFMVVEIAKEYLGESWKEDFLEKISKGGTEGVLL